MAGVRVRVFTLPNCPKCPAAKKLVREIQEEYEIDVEEIDLQRDMVTALQMGVASTPSIAVNERVISRGDIPSKEVLVEEIERYME
jgi:glutaredoxin